jgi:hypothetical protein
MSWAAASIYPSSGTVEMGGSDKGSRAVEKIMKQPVAPLDVRLWHKADIGLRGVNVCFGGKAPNQPADM